MTKELSHRANELKELGWSQNDLQTYIDLWDYRQRWGAINLEREDRQFLRKAEAALPVIQSQKISVKKPIEEKSYYCRIAFFLNQMNEAEQQIDLGNNSRGLWPILLEEELRALNYFQPVLGLPDTLKAKILTSFREDLVDSFIKQYEKKIQLHKFDFHSELIRHQSNGLNKSWHPLRDEKYKDDFNYPVIEDRSINDFRSIVRQKLIPLIVNNFPSLSDTDKQTPPDNWIPESVS